MNYKIKLEKPQDYEEVNLLTRKAFWNDEKYEKDGLGCDEHYLAHLLRDAPEFIHELDFVIEKDGKIVANIMYTHCKVIDNVGTVHKVITFGPVSVLPDYQKQGYGTIIIKHSLQIAKEMGFPAVIIFGHPEYYPRFGFKEAGDYGITTSDGHTFPAFMALELESGSLKNVSGKLHISPVFTIDQKEALNFDNQFKE